MKLSQRNTLFKIKEMRADYGKFLKSQREKSGLTQTIVASKLGYDNQQIVSNWERGHSWPPASKIKKMAKLYGISEIQLYRRTKNFMVDQAKLKFDFDYLSGK